MSSDSVPKTGTVDPVSVTMADRGRLELPHAGSQREPAFQAGAMPFRSPIQNYGCCLDQQTSGSDLSFYERLGSGRTNGALWFL